MAEEHHTQEMTITSLLNHCALIAFDPAVACLGNYAGRSRHEGCLTRSWYRALIRSD